MHIKNYLFKYLVLFFQTDVFNFLQNVMLHLRLVEDVLVKK